MKPAGFWVEDGRLHVLWPQCWKGRSLDPLQRALLNTILRQTFFVGDFKDAILEFVDLREQTPRKGRDIQVVRGADLGVVTASELADCLQILLTAFEQHSAARTARRAEEAARKKPKNVETPLFRDDGPEEG